ncbi:MAG: antitoxin family protein [Tepidisphaeraceae bacterium]|jgi:predicted DNA-binding antitoxin AbrB/MazE fold protein
MMTTTIEAVYEGGVFRPTRKLALLEGTHVDVFIPQAVQPRDPKAVAAKLSQIAAKAPRRGQSEATSRDHDQVLYGGKQHP